MARVRMVTRTVSITEVDVMCVNIGTAEVLIKTFNINGTYDNNDLIIKRVQAECEEDVKAVAVQRVDEKEVLYGMPEEEFIKLAKVLPPRTNVEE